MTRKMNKKGVSDTLLHVLTEIAVIALVIGIFFFMSGKLWGAVFGNNADDDILKSFNSLTDNVQLMIDKPGAFEHQTMIFYDKYEGGTGMHYIAGFSSPSDLGVLSSYSGNNVILFSPPCPTYGATGFRASDLTTIAYPDKCNNRPCLCLYKGLEKNFPAKPIQCKPFSDSVIFHGYFVIPEDNFYVKQQINSNPFYTFTQDPSLSSDYPDELKLPFKQLMLGAVCDSFIQDLYIEKFVSGGRTHMLVTPYLTGDQIKQRTVVHSYCPEGSDAPCIGQTMNARIGSDLCYFDEDQQKCVLKADVGECPVNIKLVKNCMCNSQLVEVSAWNSLYCHQKPDNELVVLKFDCNSITECTDYCTAVTDTAGCVFEEVDYCNQDPCDKNCVIQPTGAKYDCVLLGSG